jgi:hypothetical protein
MFKISILKLLYFLSAIMTVFALFGSVRGDNGGRLILSLEVGNGEEQLHLSYGSVIGHRADGSLFYIVSGPGDYAVDSKGNIYIADSYNCRIKKFDKDGRFLFAFGKRGKGGGEFEMFTNGSVAIDKDDNFYIIDCRSFLPGQNKEGHYHRIEKFDSSGTFLLSIEKIDDQWLGGIHDFSVSNAGHITFRTSIRGCSSTYYKFDSTGRFLGEISEGDRNEDNMGNTYYISKVGEHQTSLFKKVNRGKGILEKDDRFNISFSNDLSIQFVKILGFDENNILYIITSDNCEVETGKTKVLEGIDDDSQRVCGLSSEGELISVRKFKFIPGSRIKMDIHGNIYRLVYNIKNLTKYTQGDKVEVWKYEVKGE